MFRVASFESFIDDVTLSSRATHGPRQLARKAHVMMQLRIEVLLSKQENQCSPVQQGLVANLPVLSTDLNRLETGFDLRPTGPN